MKRFTIIFILIVYLAFACVNSDSSLKSIPDFKQDDIQWADIIYSSHGDKAQTIKKNGCALCAAANLIAYWFDDSITPIDMAKLSIQLGTCSYNGGTYSRFFSELAQQYPFIKYQNTTDIDIAIQCLDEGGLVIVSFIGGVWVESQQRGKAAHACLIYSYSEEDGFRLHDSNWPAGIMSIIIGHSTYEKVKAAARMYHCYWKQLIISFFNNTIISSIANNFYA